MIVLVKPADKNFILNKDELQNAVNFTSCNLYQKHGLDLKLLSVNADSFTVSLSGEMHGNTGNILRGLSAFLLKNYPDYNQYLKGKRLFYFFEQGDPQQEDFYSILDKELALGKGKDIIKYILDKM